MVARDTKLGPEEITRDISNLSEGAARAAGRVRHRLHRRRGRGGRRAGGQGHAQGRDPAHPGREAAARDLRREGLGCEGHVAARALGHVRHGDRRAGVHARGHRARQARPADHRRRAGALPQGPERPAAHRRGRHLRPHRAPADQQDRQRRAEEAGQGHQDHQALPGRARALTTGSTSAWPAEEAASPARAAQGEPGAEARRVRCRLRGEEEEAHQRRRAAAGRAEDGQGVPRGQAPAAAGRQDGRPARQQGRDLQDRAGGRHAAHGRRHADGRRAESAGRAFADERRPDPGDAPGLGGQGAGQAHRRSAGRAGQDRRRAQGAHAGLQLQRRARGHRLRSPTRR